MTKAMDKKTTSLETLVTNLLTTLDERFFFSELSKHISENVACDSNSINIIGADSSATLIARDGREVENGRRLEKGEGVAGQVVRTKKSYFSNSVARDPLFATCRDEDVIAELCVPVVVDGHAIATIHVQSKSEEIQFSRDNMNEVLAVLNELDKPLRNMKMYLSAKNLNESLQRQIEQKEQELQKSQSSVTIADTYRIKDKEIIGNSPTMKRIIEIADKIAAADTFALIKGESGTGKEMIARRIHCRSVRGENAFISLDCSALPEDRLEIELFGEVSGIVGGAIKERAGMIEAANNGTLFLNNIHALPVRLQAKLMNFINDGMAFRVGSQAPYRANVRVISATTKDIDEMVSEGTFREDLTYALGVLKLEAPSLRERKEDIEVLATHFLNTGKKVEDQKSLSPGAITALLEYRWPGNVRELQSIMERAYILSSGKIVERDHLAESVFSKEQHEETQEVEAISFSEMTLDELERRHIMMTLEHLSGNKTKTAKVLGITVKTLYNKLHSYGMIQPKEA